MKYLTLMKSDFVPVAVLFSHHLTHQQVMNALLLPVIGAGVAQIQRDGNVLVIPGLDTRLTPNLDIDGRLIAHDFSLTRKLFPTANSI